MGRRAYKLTGRVFGRLRVQKQVVPPTGSIKTYWRCSCDCGNERIAATKDLISGKVASCGCLRQTHGHTVNGVSSPTYAAWRSMWQRCSNPKSQNWHRYGGRGIKVEDQRWQSFDCFLADMGEKPDGLSLDRKENHLGYYKENCRWATPKEQANNRG